MSVSMKFKNITAIKNEIVKLMNESQEIKRYIVYHTDSPLSKRAKLSDGRMIEQPDVTEDLLDKNIIPFMYNEEILEVQKVMIFVYNLKGELSGSALGVNYIGIDILCPTRLNVLRNLGEERIMSIADSITDILDNKKLSHGVTTLEFQDYNEFRVSKDAEYVGLTLIAEIGTSNMRKWDRC